MDEFKLCYIDENVAWFTTAELKDQWGDDWNDRPYEHNAGDPYLSTDGSYKLCKIMYICGYADLPHYGHDNSNYSVENINAKAVPWLVYKYPGSNTPSIFAGATIEEFIRYIESCDGEVFFPKNIDADEVYPFEKCYQKLIKLNDILKNRIINKIKNYSKNIETNTHLKNKSLSKIKACDNILSKLLSIEENMKLLFKKDE